MKDNLKTILQSLLIPVALAFVGYLFNDSLQKRQYRLDNIKFSDQIINEVFDTTNIPRALAHLELLPLLITDKNLDSTITQMVDSSLMKRATQYAADGNDSSYKQLSDAINLFSGKKAKELRHELLNNPGTAYAEIAKRYADSGINYLNKGNMESSKMWFKRANESNPGIGSNNEIYKLLKSKTEGKNSDSSKVAQDVLENIKKNFPWKNHYLPERKTK